MVRSDALTNAASSRDRRHRPSPVDRAGPGLGCMAALEGAERCELEHKGVAESVAAWSVRPGAEVKEA
jgi:hypothetical protein